MSINPDFEPMNAPLLYDQHVNDNYYVLAKRRYASRGWMVGFRYIVKQSRWMNDGSSYFFKCFNMNYELRCHTFTSNPSGIFSRKIIKEYFILPFGSIRGVRLNVSLTETVLTDACRYLLAESVHAT